MKFVEFFIKRPTLFWSLMIGILLAGLIAFLNMPKLEDPVVKVIRFIRVCHVSNLSVRSSGVKSGDSGIAHHRSVAP